jgi:hypothetical protein
MTLKTKIQNLFKQTKAEVTSFGASGALAVLGIGLEHGGSVLAQSTGHPVLMVVGSIAQTSGKVMQTVAAPAAGATFISLMTKFGKAWRDMSAAQHSHNHKTPHAKPVVKKPSANRAMINDRSWDGLGVV